jgi:hypothetical protein
LFTDQPVTPTRIETLVDLLRNSRRKFDRSTLRKILQPSELPDVNSDQQAQVTLRAATELGLIADSDAIVELTMPMSKSTRAIVIEALDHRVLNATDVEPYFAPFYSYLLFLGPAGIVDQDGDEWSIAFERDVHGGERATNPFNKSKYTGLHRWYAYAGLGWYDPKGVFHPTPTERLMRHLPAIFDGERRLASDEFMKRLSTHCPELDGGAIFMDTNKDYQPGNRICSLGLSHALVELHEDARLRLVCPRDADGWNIGTAQPASDGEFLISDRVDFVELLEGAR